MGELTKEDLIGAIKEGVFGRGSVRNIRRSLKLFLRYAHLPSDIRQFKWLDSKTQNRIFEQAYKAGFINEMIRYFRYANTDVRNAWRKPLLQKIRERKQQLKNK